MLQNYGIWILCSVVVNTEYERKKKRCLNLKFPVNEMVIYLNAT